MVHLLGNLTHRASHFESEQMMDHLLLINDDPAVIPEQVRETFSRPPSRVEVASSGDAGIEHVRSDPPDIIPLDIGLPSGVPSRKTPMHSWEISPLGDADFQDKLLSAMRFQFGGHKEKPSG
jgi:CheY-like chemotaxis protein